MRGRCWLSHCRKGGSGRRTSHATAEPGPALTLQSCAGDLTTYIDHTLLVAVAALVLSDLVLTHHPLMSPPTTEQSFRANLSQFRWARGNNDETQPTDSTPVNPFSRFYNAIGGGYIPLRSSERSNEEEAYFALSRWDRLLGFGGCLLGAAVCFFVAFLTLPIIAIRPAKFALAFSLGSLLVMFGFSVLIGPINHIKHLMSKDRLPFTIAYVSSLALTLWFSLKVHSYPGSLVAAIVQVIALVSYVVAYFPGGIQTLRFGSQIALRGAGSLLPF